MKRILFFVSACMLGLAPLQAYSVPGAESPDTLQDKGGSFCKAAAYTSAYYAASMFLLGKTWYKDREGVPFHFYNDSKAYLQVDKCGHAFGSYVYSYAGYHYLVNSGMSRNDALYYGATLGLLLQTPIEIMDGLHEGYGFSWGDMAANALGSALVLGQELLFNEQVITFKFSYSDPGYAKAANGYLGTTAFDRLLKDYNGHTYWISMPIGYITNHDNLPQWMSIAVGYGANGMYGEYENVSAYNGVTLPATPRYRQYVLSLDIDWTKIETDSSLLKLLLRALTFIKLPFPAIEYNSMGQVKGHWLYF